MPSTDSIGVSLLETGCATDPENEAAVGFGSDPNQQRIAAWVALAQAGDADAFGELYRAYRDTVFRYTYYRVSSRPVAEDLTHETFVRALRGIETFSWQGRDFGAWLVTIARNLIVDTHKSSRHRMEVSTGEMLDADKIEASTEDVILELVTNQMVHDAIAQLNEQQRQCVTLRFLDQRSVAETAEVMGKNEGAVKTLQYRAVRTLARLLAPVALDLC